MRFSSEQIDSKKPVYITGMGAISALGNNVQAQFDALLAEKDKISKVSFIEGKRKEAWAGEIKLSNAELAELAGVQAGLPRTTLLGLIAAKEAWGNRNPAASKTALISSSTVGGMDLSEQFYFDYKQNASFEKVDWVKTHDIGNGADVLAKELKIEGYLTSLSTACSSAANAIMLGARLIRVGVIDRALVGGMDALANFTLSGFDSLMIYSSDKVKPFDANRKGVNLGEGAAFLVLESEESASKNQSEKLGKIVGWGNANDAYHQTASSPEGNGAQMAMKKAIEVAGISPNAIGYVNAHGTGTENNDLSESIALKKVFNDNVPLFSSTKAYTGHTLATCGSLEAIFSVLMIQNKMVFPNLRFEQKIEETALVPVVKTQKEVELNYVLSNSFGFGGNNTTLIIGKA